MPAWDTQNSMFVCTGFSLFLFCLFSLFVCTAVRPLTVTHLQYDKGGQSMEEEHTRTDAARLA